MRQQLRCAVLVLVVALAACGDDDGAQLPIDPVSPSPPAGLDTGGVPLFELDAVTPEYVAVLGGAPAGFSLVARLRSAGGQRELVLVTPAGEEVVAAADWIVLATGAFADATRGVVCWNVLTGSPSVTGGMPHPSEGLALRCRFRGVELGPVQDIADREWLVELTADSELALVTYRDATGWLYTFEAGDGHLIRQAVGTTFGPATTR